MNTIARLSLWFAAAYAENKKTILRTTGHEIPGHM
jgi:hypothetical protein